MTIETKFNIGDSAWVMSTINNTKMDIRDFVVKDNIAHFDSFRAGVLYYNIYKVNSDIGYQFQIPIEDTNGATFKAEEKSITLMRWIRKSIENKTFIKL